MPDDLHCFDKARFGVIKLDLLGRIEYANEWCARVLGMKGSGDEMLEDFLADDASVQIFRRELKVREEGHSGEYSLRVKTRTSRENGIRVQVLGTPVIDRDRTVRGAIGIIQNLEFDDVIAELRGLGEAATDAQTLFGRLTEALSRVFQFDALVVSLYEEDGRYARVFFRWYSETDGSQRMRWERPWIRLTEAQRTWVGSMTGKQRAIGDLAVFLQTDLWRSMLEEPATQHFLQLGIRSVVGLLVRDRGRTVASLSLMDRRPNLYTEADVHDLDVLPLDKCILAVLHNIQRHEMEFHFNLLQQLLKRSTVVDMSSFLVDAIGREYKLSHVSLFRVEWAAKKIKLQAQWCDEAGCRLDDHYKQDIDEGVMGRVIRDRVSLYIPDVSEEPSYKRGALDPALSSGSEFCWPVFYDDADKRVAWVFNIEDQHVDSLSPREQRSLASLAVEVGGLLQRMNDLSFLKATFASTSDPVLVVDDRGEIKKVNPAAKQLLMGRPSDYITGNIRSFLGDPQVASSFMGHDAAAVETVLRVDGLAIPVVLSSCSMPESVRGKVIMIKDMRPVRRMEELTYLGQVSREVALQAQTPLALAATWVSRLKHCLQEAAANKAAKDATLGTLPIMADRIARQLRRIQHALTRLALYDQAGAFSSEAKIPINLLAQLDSAIAHLPNEDRARIERSGDGEDIDIRGNPIHCAFVLETCLAFLLRHLPDDRKMSVVINRSDSSAVLEFRAYDASSQQEADPQERFATQLSDKLGLAETTLQSILAGFGGSFERRNDADGLTVLTVRAALASATPSPSPALRSI